MNSCSQISYVPCGCKAILSPEDPRAEIWKAVFGCLEFPLKSPQFHDAQAEGEQPSRFLKGDWMALSEDQKKRLCYEMKKKFGIGDSVFRAQMSALGYVPIKDVNIHVLICGLHTRCSS